MALETISSLCEGGMLVALFLMIFIFRMEATKTAAVIASLLPLGVVAGKGQVFVSLKHVQNIFHYNQSMFYITIKQANEMVTN